MLDLRTPAHCAPIGGAILTFTQNQLDSDGVQMSRTRLSTIGPMLLAACIGGLSVSAAAGDYLFESGLDEPTEGPYNAREASRFLTQASFGPTLIEIDRLSRIGYNAWLSEQFAAQSSLQLPFLDQLIAQAVAAGQPIEVWQDKRQEIWFRNALTGNDQLRQRVAFALSQILVISDQNGALEGNPTAIAHYYDLLSNGSFGNYRQLLEQVTLHPAMGHYLSMFKNRKPDAAQNIRPDENYAREIMQLFSIGLTRLNADGSVLDGNPALAGVQPVPTYDQTTIRGFAHVFTGWNYVGCVPPSAPEGGSLNWWDWEYCPSGPESQDWRSHAGWRTPLKPWGEGTAFGNIYHASADTKQLLSYPGVALANGVLPSGGTARANLTAALDNLFNHPNVGPFVSRLLIQRLVSSNPSPAYIGRVAAIFNNNGGGLRGDLQAVVRAILMDSEARTRPSATSNAGKLREPLLRITQLWRALDAHSVSGRINEGWPDHYSAQAAQRSPTVFNFFLPGYSLPGEVASLGLVSPEFQITTDTYITRLTNELGGKIHWAWLGNPDLGVWDPVQINLGRDLLLVNQVTRLIERYDLLFMSGAMSAPMFSTLVAHLNDINLNSWPGASRERVQDALWLILTAPEYVVEK